MLLLGYLLLGAFAGVLAGLFGVGGGLIIVPALILVFEQLGLAHSVLTHLAIGTSLATIIVTSISSIRAHHYRGGVCWPQFKQLVPGLLLGSALGASVASWVSGEYLQSCFGIFALLVAAKFWFARASKPTVQQPNAPLLAGAGVGVGCLSAIFGIGGGTLMVPLLRRFGMPIQQAVGTSSACGLPTAIAGTLAYIALLWHHPDLPPWALGPVYLPAFLGIVLASVPGAKLGAWLAYRLPEKQLQRGFSLLLLGIGLKLLLS